MKIAREPNKITDRKLKKNRNYFYNTMFNLENCFSSISLKMEEINQASGDKIELKHKLMKQRKTTILYKTLSDILNCGEAGNMFDFINNLGRIFFFTFEFAIENNLNSELYTDAQKQLILRCCNVFIKFYKDDPEHPEYKDIVKKFGDVFYGNKE